eukprot:CAMPEP_0183310062 /NCGR_PEP_ID=MMETSP0160_2-20130417/28700_1 /TAXON_ID=2839 ORGANISM="Odontella Sinensis, Strain Grunow 1884" /NCGR_SAMPLE_ID=MMETSP0160_2 /ASSEMBLY_ACC=CAM_ASM_000250 /LENGTH=155 /DNA_ID=CAMNT_0025474211 /DNA_START=233 /DNA_END=696 /DNA_ORIENTATION=+
MRAPFAPPDASWDGVVLQFIPLSLFRAHLEQDLSLTIKATQRREVSTLLPQYRALASIDSNSELSLNSQLQYHFHGHRALRYVLDFGEQPDALRARRLHDPQLQVLRPLRQLHLPRHVDRKRRPRFDYLRHLPARTALLVEQARPHRNGTEEHVP